MTFRQYHSIVCIFLLVLASGTIAGCSGLFDDLDNIEPNIDDQQQEPEQEQEEVIPEVEILSGPSERTNQTSATFEFDCSYDGDCDFRCRLNDGDEESCASPMVYDDLVDGGHTFRVTAAVADTGTESEPATREWTVDTEPPRLNIIAAPPEETFKDIATVEFECDDADDCDVSCTLEYDDRTGSPDTSEWDPCSSPFTVASLEPGEYTLDIRATDSLGNESVEQLRWTVLSQRWEVISAGYSHTCGVRDDGSLWCWGDHSNGQLGLGDTLDDKEEAHVPKRVGSHHDWTDVSASVIHTCGIRDDGSLWCWGDNSDGRLGIDDENIEQRTTPARVGSEDDWTDLSAGDRHTCGIRDGGSLWCWGVGDSGRLGGGDSESQAAPVQAGSEDDWMDLSAGSGHTCGIRDDHSLWCWGVGNGGRLGLDDTDDRNSPTRVGADSDNDNWTRVSSGAFHTCGIRDDHSLWCWGNNTDGQLGIADDDDGIVSVPTMVGDDSNWASLSTGDLHTCGIRDDDTLWCWGQGTYGQLGQGEQSGEEEPKQVAGSDNWTIVSAGRLHTCGIRAGDDRLSCWGANSNGQLGLDDTDRRDSPETVPESED